MKNYLQLILIIFFYNFLYSQQHPFAYYTPPWSCVFIDTSKIPLSPYDTSSYMYFAGNSNIIISDNVLYSTQFVNADSTDIRFAISRSLNGNNMLLGGVQSNWVINCGSGGQTNLMNIYPGNTGNFLLATFHDTLMHTYEFKWHKTDSLLHRIIDGIDSGTVKLNYTNTYQTSYLFTIGAFNVHTGIGNISPNSFKGSLKYLWLDMWKGTVDSLHHWNLNQAGQYIYDTLDYEKYGISQDPRSSDLHQGFTVARDSLDCLLVHSAYDSKFSDLGSTVIVNKNMAANNWSPSHIYNMKLCHDTSIIAVGTFNRINANPNSSISGDVANSIFNYNLKTGVYTTFLGGTDNNYFENVEVYKTGFVAIGPTNSVNGIPNTQHMAYWDGTQWVSIGNISSSLRAIMTSGNNLYIGGVFANVGGVSVTNFAMYDGNNWRAMGSGPNGEVEDIIIYNGDTIISGRFTQAGGVANTSRIAKWTGTTYAPLGVGSNNVIYKLAVFNSELYAMGAFTTIGGLSCSVGAWNGSSWRAVVSSISGFVGVPEPRFMSAAVLNDQLYLGGNFARVNDHLTMRLIKTDGINICPVGDPGADGEIWAIVPVDCSLYLGGNFNMLDGIPAQLFAKYTPQILTGLYNQENILSGFYLKQNYPNPFNPMTSIYYGLPGPGMVQLIVYDILGRVVKILINEFKNAGSYSVEFDGNSFPSGVYFYRLHINSFVQTNKMVLVK